MEECMILSFFLISADLCLPDKGLCITADLCLPDKGLCVTADLCLPEKGLCITADLVAPVLKFLAEISKELAMKDWLGGPEGSIFWPVLLSLMCVTQTMVPSGDGPSSTKQTKVCIDMPTLRFISVLIHELKWLCTGENCLVFYIALLKCRLYKNYLPLLIW